MRSIQFMQVLAKILILFDLKNNQIIKVELKSIERFRNIKRAY